MSAEDPRHAQTTRDETVTGKSADGSHRAARIWRMNALAANYQLTPSSHRHRADTGCNLGNESGTSLDFHDYREYQPGDDLRRVDWGVFARSDALVIRQYRVELSPVLDVIVDISASMGAYPAKAELAVAVAAFLSGVCRASGGQVALTAQSVRHTGAGVAAAMQKLTFDEPGDGGGLVPSLWSQVGGRPARVLISDFLFPQEMDGLIAQAARGAGNLIVIQILAEQERDPELRGSMRLVDATTLDRKRDLHVRAVHLEQYKERLAGHIGMLSHAIRRQHATLVELTAPAAASSLLPNDGRKPVDAIPDFSEKPQGWFLDAFLKHAVVEPA